MQTNLMRFDVNEVSEDAMMENMKRKNWVAEEVRAVTQGYEKVNKSHITKWQAVATETSHSY
jgi:hypothetical protein